MVRNASRYVIILFLASLVAKSTVAVEIVLFRHVISEDNVIKGSCDLIGKSPSR